MRSIVAGVALATAWFLSSATAQARCDYVGSQYAVGGYICASPVGNAPQPSWNARREFQAAQRQQAAAPTAAQLVAQHWQAAQAANARGDYETALREFLAAQALGDSPQLRANIALVRGNIALRAGDYATAATSYRQAESVYPWAATYVAQFQAKLTQQSDVRAAGDPLVQSMAGAANADPARDPAVQALAAAAAPGVVRDGRSYERAGRALIGGTTWIAGYNVRTADPAVVSEARRDLAAQMKLAGIPYADGVDFARYNFVLGIAASTDASEDLARRVIFDEYRNGQYTAENQAGYDALRGRQFDELASHSNGAMICLAALENRDVIADRVVLYGPQITVESLKLWDELVRAHKVKSVQVYVDGGDPVPALSLAVGGGALLAGSHAFFKPAALANAIETVAPQVAVRTFACSPSPALRCHAMETYKAGLAHAAFCAHPSTAAVPGTRLRGTASLEPPPPC